MATTFKWRNITVAAAGRATVARLASGEKGGRLLFGAGASSLHLRIKLDRSLSRRGRRGHQLAKGVDQGDDLAVVLFQLSLQVGELAGQHAAQPDKGADNEDAGLDRTRRVQDVGRHDGPVLGEGERTVFDICPLLQGHNL
jgi:hypothetical protein